MKKYLIIAIFKFLQLVKNCLYLKLMQAGLFNQE